MIHSWARICVERLSFALFRSTGGFARYEDRNAMTHSIENRVPFLTPQMAQLDTFYARNVSDLEVGYN